jgi:hypothetical protein
VNTHRHNNNYNEEKRAPEYSKISTDEMKPSGRILYSKGFAREIEYNNANLFPVDSINIVYCH